MKQLIILSAIPASGKSTWARKYASEHSNTFIVSSDQIREEITGRFDDHSQQPLVWETFSKRIKEYAQNDGCTVILDALNDRNALREKYVKENPEFDKYILVVFPHDYKESIRLNALRPLTHRVPDEAINELIKKFEEPSEEVKKLFDEIWEVKLEDLLKEAKL